MTQIRNTDRIGKAAVLGRQTGTVVWFNDAKGIGFLRPEDGSQDVFVHFSGIAGDRHGRRTLLPEQRVEFEVENGPKGLFATQVRVRT